MTCVDPGHNPISRGKVAIVAHGLCGTCYQRRRRREAGVSPARRRPGQRSRAVAVSVANHARLARLALERGTSVAAEADAAIAIGLPPESR